MSHSTSQNICLSYGFYIGIGHIICWEVRPYKAIYFGYIQHDKQLNLWLMFHCLGDGELIFIMFRGDGLGDVVA